jgi:flagellar hook-length control protein FliK
MNELLSSTKPQEIQKASMPKPSSRNDDSGCNHDFKDSLDKETKPQSNNLEKDNQDSDINEYPTKTATDPQDATFTTPIIDTQLPITEVLKNTIKPGQIFSLSSKNNVATQQPASTIQPTPVQANPNSIGTTPTEVPAHIPKALHTTNTIIKDQPQTNIKQKNVSADKSSFVTQLNENHTTQEDTQEAPIANLNTKNIPFAIKEDTLIKPTIISTASSTNINALSDSDSSSNIELKDTPVQKTITERVHILDKKWPENMAAKIALNSANGAQELKVNINPAKMGPIEIQITQSESGMNFNILVSTPSTKDLLDSYSQKIQQALLDSGMDLGGFDINKQTKDETGSDENNSGNKSNSQDTYLNQSEEIETIRLHTGLLDSYA